MNPSSTRAAIAAFCLCALSGLASAQGPAASDSASARNDANRPVPTLMAIAPDSTVRFAAPAPDMASVVRRKQAFDRPTVLMIVGGALIVTGLIVGDDAATILYLAGAGIGGYGLYLYLQQPDTRFTR